jgi:predicted nucleic acid-binding protein
MEAVQTLHADIVPVLTIEWIGATLHALAIDRLLAAFNRQISLVDWISFCTMQRSHIKTAFGFDQDFRTQGFETVPSEMEQPQSRQRIEPRRILSFSV